MEFILYFRCKDVPVGTNLFLISILDGENNLSVARNRIVHFAAVEAYEAQTSIQFLIFEEEEAGKNLDGIGALLVDVIA